MCCASPTGLVPDAPNPPPQPLGFSARRTKKRPPPQLPRPPRPPSRPPPNTILDTLLRDTDFSPTEHARLGLQPGKHYSRRRRGGAEQGRREHPWLFSIRTPPQSHAGFVRTGALAPHGRPDPGGRSRLPGLPGHSLAEVQAASSSGSGAVESPETPSPPQRNWPGTKAAPSAEKGCVVLRHFKLGERAKEDGFPPPQDTHTHSFPQRQRREC